MNKLYLDACYYADTISNMFNLYNTRAKKEREEITSWTNLNLIGTTKHLKHDRWHVQFFTAWQTDIQRKIDDKIPVPTVIFRFTSRCLKTRLLFRLHLHLLAILEAIL